MLGPIGSEIMAIFRLLSPDEIDKYIIEEKANSYKTGEVTALAAGAEGIPLATEHADLTDTEDSGKFPKDHQAKILPLHGEEEAPEKKKKEQHHKKEQEPEGFGLESIGVMSAAEIKRQEKQREEDERKTRDSATVFLLKERQRLKSAKKKMIEQSALKSYQINASQEFYDPNIDSEEGEEEEKADDLRGILLNKRHY